MCPFPGEKAFWSEDRPVSVLLPSDYASWSVLRPAFTLQLKCFVNTLVCLLFQSSLVLPHLPSPMSILPLQHKVYIRVICFLPGTVRCSGHVCPYGQARRARELTLPGNSPSCGRQLRPPRWGSGRRELGTVSWRPWGGGCYLLPALHWACAQCIWQLDLLLGMASSPQRCPDTLGLYYMYKPQGSSL